MDSRNLHNDDIFYDAYLRHDSRFEGIFFLGVKTTGVFCRPGCKARAPRRENVAFFESASEALEQGYRPCKKCHPLSLPGSVPDWVQQARDLIKRNPDHHLTDRQLQQQGHDPVRLRRWFLQQYGQTFQAYQREQKIQQAHRSISQGNKVIDSALDAGYQSLSGFHQSFKKLTGITPGDSSLSRLIAVRWMQTPLGPMYAAADDDGLCMLEFHDRKALARQISELQRRLKARFIAGDHPLFDTLQQQLDAYFQRQLTQFDIPLNLSGSEFQRQAWASLRAIPYGQSRNYQQQAAAMGKPDAIRAVATANAKNPVAILVPCHRVIAKSGELAGYAGGIWRKRFLLNLEQGTSQHS